MPMKSIDSIVSNGLQKTNQMLDKKDQKSSAYVDWSQIGNTRPVKDIDSWTKRDYVHHINRLFTAKFNHSIYQYAGLMLMQEEVGRLRDYIKNRLGRPIDNSMLKEYIDWYFENNAKIDIGNRECEFSPSWLRRSPSVTAFLRDRRWSGRGEDLPIKPQESDCFRPKTKTAKMRKRSGVDADPSFTQEHMETVFNASRQYFLATYGAVIAYAWLVNKKGFSPKDAANFIASGVQSMMGGNNSMLDLFEENTKLFSPYPKWNELEEISAIMSMLETITKRVFTDANIRTHKAVRFLSFLHKE